MSLHYQSFDEEHSWILLSFLRRVTYGCGISVIDAELNCSEGQKVGLRWGGWGNQHSVNSIIIFNREQTEEDGGGWEMPVSCNELIN